MMKPFLKNILRRIVGMIAKALIRSGLVGKYVMVQMDGGICSQMHFYRIATLMDRAGVRTRLSYRWYRYFATDTDGRFCRNLDLPKLFPGIDLKGTSRLLEELYRISFEKEIDYFRGDACSDEWLSLKAPLYVTGYFHDDDEVYGCGFREMFRLNPDVLDERNRELYSIIEDKNRNGWSTVAVHVRRGDLSKYSPAYGNPAEEDYFSKAISQLSSAREDIVFYLFSDEPCWVKERLGDLLASLNHQVIDWNGSDKGYMDLVLMSRCRDIVASQGTLGKFAALLRPEELLDGCVIMPSGISSAEWTGRFRNSEVI